MRKNISLLVCVLFCLVPAFSNGGIHWFEVGSGTNPAVIKLKNDSQIDLKKENLKLTFVDNAVIVNCDYILYNSHPTDTQIDFAFNIGYAGTDSLLYYNICVNDENVSSVYHTDVEREEFYSYSYWELSTLKLPADSESTVSVCYKVETKNSGTYYGSNFTDNTFVYNLFPALSFGNGIIEDFTLTLDVSDIVGYNGQIIKIDGVDIDVGSKRIITKSFSNFDLNTHKVLEITYNIKNWYFERLYKLYKERPIIKATSELQEGRTVYSASNLGDDDCNTAWVEGKSDFGKNERIEIQISGIITHLLLVNGFRKNSKTYYENNRIKRIALYVDGIKLGEMEFPDREYKFVDMFNILDEGELINLGNFFEGPKVFSSAKAFWPNSKIEIEILDVYRGTKYNDTCVSDIYIISAPIPTP